MMQEGGSLDTDWLQSLIYTMNEVPIRNQIVRNALRESLSSQRPKYRWKGTWTFELLPDNSLRMRDPSCSLFHEFLQSRWKCKTPVISLFTVCLVYDGNRVHYVAFVYRSDDQTLLSFDPGVGLYPHGQRTIVPYIRNTFSQLKWVSASRDVGRCHDFTFCGKRWGIQYNGDYTYSFPADAFCQTWTLFFVTRMVIQDDTSDVSFVDTWCKIHPPRREEFLLLSFVLPELRTNRSLQKQYLSQLQMSPRSFPYVLRTLTEYVESSYASTGRKPPSIRCPPVFRDIKIDGEKKKKGRL